MKFSMLMVVMIFVLALLIITGSCAAPTPARIEHPMVVQREIEFPDMKPFLYWTANEWMEITLIGSDAGIQYQNDEEGVIVGIGVTRLKSSDIFDAVYDFRYKLIVEVYDYKTIATIESNYGQGEIQENVIIIIEPHLMSPEDYEKLKAQFNKMIDDLVSYMKNGSVALEYNNNGITKGKKGDYEGAIKEFTKAIEINPNYPGSYDNRGIARRYMGDYEGAIADHTKAIELNLNLFGAYNNRGIAKGYMSDYEGAIRDLTKAIELNPGHYGLYFNRGNTRSDNGDYEGAIKDLTKAIEINPSLSDAYNNRGWIYVKQEKYQDAISDLNEALAISETAPFYDTRGWAYFFLDSLEEARQDAVSALELDSEAYNARALLYRIEIQKGDKDEALTSLKSYISNYEGKDIKDNYFWILKYFTNEVTLEYLKNNPQWDDLRIALKYY